MKTPINQLLAYELYLKSTVLTNDDIKQLFNVNSSSSLKKIKKDILLAMAERGIFLSNGKIATNVAFEVWGFDEKELERRYAKAKKYNIM